MSHDSALVDAAWAQAHLDDPNVRFVEVDVDTAAYEQSHLPGAVGWNWTSQLSDGIRRDIASREDFCALLSASGIGPDTTIVLYGDNNNWFAAWAYWQLKLYGHDDVRILDGGRKYWLDKGLPLTTDVPAYDDDRLPAARGRLRAAGVPRRHPAAARRPGARPRRRAIAGRVQRRDHRPARHEPRPPSDRVTSRVPPASRGRRPSRRTAPSSRRTSWPPLYEAKGVTAGQGRHRLLPHRRALVAHWFVLHELLGYERVRNYDGSWTEYGSLIGVPIEKPVAVAAEA